MEPEINLNLNDLRVVREKQDRDVLVGMVFGASAVLSLTLTAMLGVRFLNTGKPGPVAALIALTLIGSIASYFAAKRDERWFVLCSILNHMGIGLGLFLLLAATDAVVRPLYLALSGLPACAGLCGASMLFRAVDGKNRIRTVVVGAAAIGILAIVSIVMAVRTVQEIWIGSAVSAVTCCAAFCGMAWTATKQDRSVYWTMAVVSFTIYLLVLLVAAAFLAAAAFANSGSSGKSNRSSSRKKSSGGVFRTGYRPRFRSSWFYYPLFSSSRNRSYDEGVRGVGAPDPAVDSGFEEYRRTERKKLRGLLIVLSVLFLSVLILALLMA